MSSFVLGRQARNAYDAYNSIRGEKVSALLAQCPSTLLHLNDLALLFCGMKFAVHRCVQDAFADSYVRMPGCDACARCGRFVDIGGWLRMIWGVMCLLPH